MWKLQSRNTPFFYSIYHKEHTRCPWALDLSPAKSDGCVVGAHITEFNSKRNNAMKLASYVVLGEDFLVALMLESAAFALASVVLDPQVL